MGSRLARRGPAADPQRCSSSLRPSPGSQTSLHSVRPGRRASGVRVFGLYSRTATGSIHSSALTPSCPSSHVVSVFCWPSFGPTVTNCHSLTWESLRDAVDMVYRAGAAWLPLVLSSFAPESLARGVGPRDSVPEGYHAAPYYPTPHGGWLPSWSDAYAKAQALVSQMTLAEKTNITSGTGFLMGRTSLFTLVALCR